MIDLVIISGLFTLGYVVLMRRYALLWKSIGYVPSDQSVDVTLVVAFRNEEAHLPSLLESIRQQQYPKEKLRVLFVDDHSEDRGVAIIQNTDLPFDCSVISLKDGLGKKAAIKTAWNHVQTEFIVHTDADCTMGPHWLKTLLAPFSDPHCDFISGPVKYVAMNGFWQRLLALDFASLVAIGGAHIAWDAPMICNGANLAYRKRWIKQLNLQEQRASGEDVFLMQSISKGGGGVIFCKHADAMVRTHPPHSFKQFLHQRLRWASKNTGYSGWKNNAVLVFSWLFNLLILTSLIIGTKIAFTLFLWMVCMKVLFEAAFYREIGLFFGLRSIYPTLIFGQIFHIVYMGVLPIASKLFKYQWKGRKLS